MIRNLFLSWGRAGWVYRSQLAFYALPIVVQGGLPMLTLPLTTLVLTPEDYGILGLVSVYTGGFSLVASLGSGFQLSMVRMGTPRAHSLIKAVSALSLLLSCAFAAASYVIWWFTRQYHIVPNAIDWERVITALVAMVLSTPWLVARPLAVLQQRSRLFSFVSTGRILISTAVILIALFQFDQGGFSLFLGLLALGVVDFAGALLVLAPSMSAVVDRGMIWEVIRKGMTITGGAVSNMFLPIFERSMLAGAAGAAALGLYVHAQSYQKFLTDVTDPFRQLVWPQLLKASRGDAPYAQPASFFSLIYALVAFSGLIFASFGQAFINLLTHGRFGGAAPYAAIMIAILLLILLARPQYALISAGGDARAATVSAWISSGCAAVLMLFVVPLWGALGLLGAVAVRYLILAVCFHVFARWHGSTPIMDGPPLVGAMAIVAVTAAVHLSGGQVGVMMPVLGGAILFVILSLLLMTSAVTRFDADQRGMQNVASGAVAVTRGS
jgi:O-antigen/teichoic acid export membrane protein